MDWGQSASLPTLETNLNSLDSREVMKTEGPQAINIFDARVPLSQLCRKVNDPQTRIVLKVDSIQCDLCRQWPTS